MIKTNLRQKEMKASDKVKMSVKETKDQVIVTTTSVGKNRFDNIVETIINEPFRKKEDLQEIIDETKIDRKKCQDSIKEFQKTLKAINKKYGKDLNSRGFKIFKNKHQDERFNFFAAIVKMEDAGHNVDLHLQNHDMNEYDKVKKYIHSDKYKEFRRLFEGEIDLSRLKKDIEMNQESVKFYNVVIEMYKYAKGLL